MALSFIPRFRRSTYVTNGRLVRQSWWQIGTRIFRQRFSVGVAVAVFAMIALPILAVAQDVAAAAVDPFPIEGVVAGLIAVLTPVVLWGIKKIPFVNLPTWTLPILAGTVIPMLLNWIATLAATPDLPWYAAPLLGLVGVGLREVIDQLGKIGKAKQVPPALEV